MKVVSQIDVGFMVEKRISVAEALEEMADSIEGLRRGMRASLDHTPRRHVSESSEDASDCTPHKRSGPLGDDCPGPLERRHHISVASVLQQPLGACSGNQCKS